MKISARSCGGFAGLAAAYDLDTAAHPAGNELEDLLHQLDFFSAAPVCPVGADMPRWEITVEDGPRCHTVFVREDGSGGDWQALLDRLRSTA
ncbi:protealysin inhibitor emfourin [Telluria aromaticivorans]|uniref:Uncharacterized protein n=1 Tax=Telluria aromaticivorans TaxID=2725995 RepID=A0A7Y2K256_9BURK|nr:protealysin inhibitor emfourin [Telluria aromaticivorans]NNG25277.1 hypothetical protein [Telluria aromaticivorans]